MEALFFGRMEPMSAPKQQTPKHGSGHRHPPELRERAVRMVEETIKQTGERHGVVTRVAVQLGLGSEMRAHRSAVGRSRRIRAPWTWGCRDDRRLLDCHRGGGSGPLAGQP